MEVVVVESHQVDEATRVALRTLWERAFAGRFTAEDEAHAYGGVHVIAREGERIAGHASAVPRRIRFGQRDGPTSGTSKPWPPTPSTRAKASADA